jgi:branched-subunit amino acid ABC-type transport system permease component
MILTSSREREISQQLVNGLALGAVYAPDRHRLSMVYGVRFPSISPTVMCVHASALPFFSRRRLRSFGSVRLVAGSPRMAATMVDLRDHRHQIELLCIAPLRNRPRLVLITAPVSPLRSSNTPASIKPLRSLPASLPQLLPTGNFIGGLSFTTQLVVPVTVVLLVALTFIVKDPIGRKRAVSITRPPLMGISNPFIISFTFGLGLHWLARAAFSTHAPTPVSSH